MPTARHGFSCTNSSVALAVSFAFASAARSASESLILAFASETWMRSRAAETFSPACDAVARSSSSASETTSFRSATSFSLLASVLMGWALISDASLAGTEGRRKVPGFVGAGNGARLTFPAMAFADYAAAFRSRKIGLLLLLGFASGLPLALTAGTLQAWLAAENVDIVAIGWFALVGQPYTYKFLWAPLMDRYTPLPALGRRRGWLLLTQLALAGAIAFMGTLSPRDSAWLLGATALAVAFLSASQDIVFDALRADWLEREERGAGAAVSVLGYRVAMLVSGAGALILADQWLGWAATYWL